MLIFSLCDAVRPERFVRWSQADSRAGFSDAFFFLTHGISSACRPCPPDSFANLRFAANWAKRVGWKITCFFIVWRKAVPKWAFLVKD